MSWHSWFIWFLWLFVVVRPAASDTELDQWPSFRGPLSCGVAPHADPPVSWSSSRNVKWKVAVPGRASSSPIVWGDHVFLTSAISKSPPGEQPKTGDRRRPRVAPTEHEFVVLCLSRETGETIWSKVATVGTPKEAVHLDNTFASASPCTDGERVIVNFGSQGLFCYDFAGDQLWARKDLGTMTTRGSFGEGSSPAIHGDVVVLPWDHEGNSYIESIDIKSGQKKWRADRSESTNWVTPLIVEQEEGVQVVQSGQELTRGYDLATGEELWNYAGLTQRPVSSPVAYRGVAYFASSRGGSFLGAVRMDGQGNLNGSDAELWSVTKGTPDIPSLLLVDDRLYFLTANKAVLTCVNAVTGETITAAKRLGNMRAVYSSPVSAAGRIYVTGRDGQTIVMEDGPGLKILAENELDEPIDATPALVGSQLFMRTAEHLYCLEDSEE